MKTGDPVKSADIVKSQKEEKVSKRKETGEKLFARPFENLETSRCEKPYCLGHWLILWESLTVTKK